MDFNELQAKLEGLSEAQLKVILQVAWGELSAEKQKLVVRLAEAMAKVSKG
ncbi:unnamed protein product [marine sediment metagenome]|uniref:Uncharacterized protein n=1 Tax=marine sediment metagenome TaxID=412755 RepID=X1T7S8_9ZZZZ